MVDMLSFDADDAGYVTELADYVAVPSVSRDAARETMLAAADWLVGQLGFHRPRVEHVPVVTDGRGNVLGVADGLLDAGHVEFRRIPR